VSFIKPRETIRDKQAIDPEWADLPTVYIQFAIEDTGRGLSDKEMEVLFTRFSQASPKTYGQYGLSSYEHPIFCWPADIFIGGSGLGLFISRELAELSGGQIGVASMGKKDYVPRRHTPLKHLQKTVDLYLLSTSLLSSYRQIQSPLFQLLHIS